MELWMQLKEIQDLLWEHTSILWGMGIASTVMFLLGVIAMPWILIRLPQDFFLSFQQPRPYISRLSRGKQVFLLVFKNAAGSFCLIVGLIMLILPGQGLLTIILGLTLMNFPGKHRLMRRMLSSYYVQKTLNWLRHRMGKKPFLFPSLPRP